MGGWYDGFEAQKSLCAVEVNGSEGKSRRFSKV